MDKCCHTSLHLNNKFKQKAGYLQATLYIDSVLNMHSEDLLSCFSSPGKLDKRHQKMVYPVSHPHSYSCQRLNLQSR